MKNKPIFLKIFIFFSLVAVPLMVISTVYHDMVFIYGEDLHIELSSTMLMRSFLKICLLIYSIAISYSMLKNKWDIKSIKIYLIVMAFSPIILEIPYFILSLKVDAPIFFRFINKLLPITLPFYAVWFAYFSSSKFIKEFEKQKSNNINV